MADNANVEVGRHLASDLRRIREDRGITLEALHEQTKIPYNLLESFEQTGLFDHPMFNRVYLRSFLRTYSEVVGVPTVTALAGLDEALDGVYNGALGREFLGDAPAGTAPAASAPATLAPVAPSTLGAEPSAPVDAPPPPEVAESRPPEAEPDLPEPYTDAELPSADDIVVEPEPFPAAPPVQAAEPVGPPPDVEPLPVHEPESAPAASVFQESEAPPPPPPPVAPVSGRKVGRPEEHPPVSPARSEEPSAGRKSTPRAVFALVGLLVLAGIVYGAVRLIGGSGEEERRDDEQSAAVATPVVPADTVAAPVAIGDSMDVTVVAANGPVRDIKVTVDDDLRRPYWIEDGQSRTFQAVDRIVIERQLPMVQLQLESRPYPKDRVDEQGRVVITRETAQQFLSAQ